MSEIITMARKELRHILRDPKTMMFIVGMPVMLLIIYGYGINFDVRDIRMAVVDYDKTAASREFLDSMVASDYFVINQYCNNYDEIDEAINRQQARVGVIIPPNFERDLKSGRSAEIQLLIDGSDGNTANIAYGYINALTNLSNIDHLRSRLLSLGIENAQLIPTVDVKSRYWFNPELKSSNFIIPGVIAIIMMLIGAVATTLTIVSEKENGTIEQLIVSPIKPYQIIVGKLIPYILLSFLALIIVLFFALLLFDLPVKGSLVQLLLMSVVYLVSVLGIGIFVSSVSDDLSTAMLLSITITMLPSIILSGFIFPIRNMPAILQVFSLIVPARYFLRIIRGIYLKGIGLSLLWPEVVFLMIFAVVVFSISIARFKKRLD